MTKQIVVFGSNGMIGSAICSYFEQRGWNVSRITRVDIDIVSLYLSDMLYKVILRLVEGCDLVVNCINTKRLDDCMIVNAIFPAYLARASTKTIHISTDEMFEPYTTGGYKSDSLPIATSIFGISRWAGELAGCRVIRVSVIGDLAPNHVSIPNALKSLDKDAKILASSTFYWNGLTTYIVASIVYNTLSDSWKGVRTYTSSETISKVDLYRILANVYELDSLEVCPVDDGPVVNRILIADKDCEIDTPFVDQIRAMKHLV